MTVHINIVVSWVMAPFNRAGWSSFNTPRFY
jgi:hypothetical protein